ARSPLDAPALALPLNDHEPANIPAALDGIRRDTERIGLTLASEPKTGSLLRALAASTPRGEFLEIGTGTGVGTAWLLAGVDANSRLASVDSDPKELEIARRHRGHDSRVTLRLVDGATFLCCHEVGLGVRVHDARPNECRLTRSGA